VASSLSVHSGGWTGFGRGRYAAAVATLAPARPRHQPSTNATPPPPLLPASPPPPGVASSASSPLPPPGLASGGLQDRCGMYIL
jgi:hypothetical protein